MTLWSVLCNATGLNRLKESSLFNSEGYGGWKRDTVRAVDIVVGCFFLIDRDLWEELHGFDPLFFMYGEEADLCQRARQSRRATDVTPTATIIHYGGASESDKADQRIKVLASKITLMRRQWSALSAFAGRLLYLMASAHSIGCLWYSLGPLLGRADFQRNAQTWRQVWRSRQRWINGWSDIGATNPQGGLSPNALDFGVDRESGGSGCLSVNLQDKVDVPRDSSRCLSSHRR